MKLDVKTFKKRIKAYTLQRRHKELIFVIIRYRLCAPARVPSQSPTGDRSDKWLITYQSDEYHALGVGAYLRVIESVNQVRNKCRQMRFDCINTTFTVRSVLPRDAS